MYYFLMANVFDKIFETDETTLSSATGTIRLLTPEKFLDCYKAAEMLRNDEMVLVNIEKMDPEYKQRYLDFISGVIMAIDGKIRKVDRNIVLCVPPKFELAGDISGE